MAPAGAGASRTFNPADGSLLARVAVSSAADYETAMVRAAQAARDWAAVPAPARGADRAPLCRGAARAQAGTGHGHRARERQDPGRGARRSAGDDRHRRFCGRPVAHALRPDDALRAAAAPHVRAVASARRGRHHHRLQFSGRCVVLERAAGGHLRQCQHLEALAEDAAVRTGRAAAVRPGARSGIWRRRFFSC